MIGTLPMWAGDLKKSSAKKTKGIPSDDYSFVTLGRTEYLAYLRHENKKGKKKEEKLEEE